MLFAKPIRSGAAVPRVSIIIAAHNEEDVIEDKLRNTKELEYPRDRLEVIVASDGSDDRTNQLVRNFGDSMIRLLSLPRVGKNCAVNAAVANAAGEVLVFTDADSRLKADALRTLVAPLQDPEVGGVGGDYRYEPDPAAGAGEITYWSIDRSWKRLQSRAGSMTSATGQIYALRRELFKGIPSGVTDDFYCSIQAPAAGQRLIYAPDAIAYGPIANSLGAEYSRKVRVMTRGLTSILKMKRLLNPFRYGFYSIQLFSHKLLRRLMTIPFTCLFVSNVFLVDRGRMYVFTLLLQFAFYSSVLFGFLLRHSRLGHLRLFTLPLYFVMVNLAGAVAALNLVRGKHYDRWITVRTSMHDQRNK
jgi:cellulose synthase/poly-beta-1,6-N-acetylglucosamine synthase-like glycosyltransferase